MFTNFEKLFIEVTKRSYFNIFHENYGNEKVLIFQPDRGKSYHETCRVTSRTRVLFGQEKMPGFFTKNSNWVESSKENFYDWHAQEKCEELRKASVFKKMRAKVNEVLTFTEKEIEKHQFKPCNCIEKLLPEHFNFFSPASYKTLLNANSNTFITELKIFVFKATCEKMMDNEIDLLYFSNASTLHEEKINVEKSQKYLTDFPNVIKSYETLRENLTEDILKTWDPFEIFFEILNQEKENYVKQLKSCEEKTSKEFISKYLMNTAVYYNNNDTDASFDGTLILCHLKWGASNRDMGQEENTSEENHRLEVADEKVFIRACVQANPHIRYSYIQLYQNLMTAYNHIIIPDSKYALENELFIMMPAEVYEMLKNVSKTVKFEHSRRYPSRQFKIKAAYSFEITKEKFENEAFIETLITLNQDNTMNFSETVKTAWNLQK